MRKWVPTILVVIVLIVGWVYAASQNYFREEEEAAQAKLLGIQSGDIQSITIHDTTEETAGTAATSTLTLENGVWQMVEPKAYPLNGYSVNSWLDALSGANQELVVEEAPTDLNKYGLGTDATRMDIKLKDNREIKLTIGGQLPADDARYVRVDEGPVVAVQTEAITNIALSRRDLLDTTPFNMDETNVGSLEWEGEAATWMLTSTSENDAAEQAWTLNGKTIDSTDAISLIGKIKNLSTADDVRKASELKGTVPRFTLSVEQTVNGQQVRDVYRGLTVPSKPEIWVITPDGQWAYGMDATSLTEAEKFPDTIKASTTSSEESSSSAHDATTSSSTDGK